MSLKAFFAEDWHTIMLFYNSYRLGCRFIFSDMTRCLAFGTERLKNPSKCTSILLGIRLWCAIHLFLWRRTEYSTVYISLTLNLACLVF